MRTRLPLALAAVALAALIGVAVTLAVVATDDDETVVVAPGLGMMGVAGYGGMMAGGGMMGGGLGAQGNVEPVESMQEAASRVESWLADAGFDGFQVAEVMAFSNGYYIAVDDAAGKGAFELLLDPATGWIAQEPGPSMMWNTEYGLMGGRFGSSMMGGGFGGMMLGPGMMGQQGSQIAGPLFAEKAQQVANRWLEQALPGETAGDPRAFPGYYTFDTERNGQPQGMLSVNAQTGAVWYHVWHGSFVDELTA